MAGDSFLVSIPPMVVAGVFIALLAAVVVLVGSVVSLNARQKHLLKHITQLDRQLSILSSGSFGMGQRMVAMEKRLNGFQKAFDEYKESDTDFTYAQAQKLVAQGLDSSAIAASSGLSESEISLMEILHRKVPAEDGISAAARKFKANSLDTVE